MSLPVYHIRRHLPAPFRGEGLGITTTGFLVHQPRIAAMPLIQLCISPLGLPVLALGRSGPSGSQVTPAQRCPTVHHGPSNAGPTHSPCRARPAGSGWYACAGALRVVGPHVPEKGIHPPVGDSGVRR